MVSKEQRIGTQSYILADMTGRNNETIPLGVNFNYFENNQALP